MLTPFYLSTQKTIADRFYDRNETIAVFTNVPGTGLVSSGSGFMQIPTAGFSGECVDSNYVKFENNKEPRSCIRPLSDTSSADGKAAFIQQCVSDFSMARYVTNLWVARSADVLSAVGLTTTDVAVPVTIGQVIYRDHVTGVQTDVTATWVAQSCATKGYSTLALFGAAKPNCLFTANLVAPAVDASSAVCQGFVAGVLYNVQHSASSQGTINTVVATVTVTDVPVSPTAIDQVTIKQTFGVTFQSADATRSTDVNGNLVYRPRSGNPGYLQGTPVLYGVYQPAVAFGKKGTVLEQIGGLTVPAPLVSFDSARIGQFGHSICPQSATASAQTPLKFGYDVSTGCVLSVNRAQFEALCCLGNSQCSLPQPTSSPFASSGTGIPHFFNFTAGYVGIYGNADPLDASQWMPLFTTIPTSTSSPRRFNPVTGVCTNFYTSLNYQFLVAYTGEKLNPQNKIIAATAQLTTSDVVFRVPYGDTNTTQQIPLTVTASFVYTDAQNLQGYRPPPPPVLFQIPFDVFYPFYESAAPRSVGASASLPLVVSTLLVTVVALMCA